MYCCIDLTNLSKRLVLLGALIAVMAIGTMPATVLAQGKSNGKEIQATERGDALASRIALVIANENYTPRLPNILNDGNAMQTVLKDAGFEVTLVTDVTNREALKVAIRTFANKIRPSSLVVVYYSGHGVQYNGDNYLVPTKAVVENAADYEEELLPLSYVLNGINKGRLKVVILDACRNSPFKSLYKDTGVGDGLASVAAPRGTLIAYATSPGSVASSFHPKRANSMYTGVLVQKLRQRDRSLLSVLTDTRDEVMTLSNETQVPWEENSLRGEFVLFPIVTVAPLRPSTEGYRSTVDYRAAEAVFLSGRMQTARRLLRPLAETGDARAQGMLGDCLDEDSDTYGEAFSWYRKAAEQGDPFAMSNLGWMYELGYGTNKDLTQANKWYAKSLPGLQNGADNRDGLSMMQLAYMYTGGYGVVKDEAKAVEWYRKAAEQRLAIAQYSLGVMYSKGSGTAKDEVKAVEWLQKAADQGSAAAQNSLGNIYYGGTGVAKNYVKAMEWYHQAAEQGNASAQNSLGEMYQAGEGVAKDEMKAMKWYQKSATHGYDRAQYNIGVLYFTGSGTAKDEVKSVEWFQKAAKQGYASAQNRLGVMLHSGQGILRDDGRAVGWFLGAATQGMAMGQFNLGYMYENGYGVAKSRTKAVWWYRKSAAQDIEDAKAALKRLGD